METKKIDCHNCKYFYIFPEIVHGHCVIQNGEVFTQDGCAVEEIRDNFYNYEKLKKGK